MRQRHKVGDWVVGQIADFTSSTIHPGAAADTSIYLIERVAATTGASGRRYARVNFRKLDTWKLFEGDSREHDSKSSGCVIREPTDEEFAMIAKQRLLGGEQP